MEHELYALRQCARLLRLKIANLPEEMRRRWRIALAISQAKSKPRFVVTPQGNTKDNHAASR